MKIKFSAIITIAVLTFFSCKENKNDPKPVNPGAGDQEVMTRLELQLINISNPSDKIFAKFNDPEGEGKGAPPTTDSLKLKAGSSYSAVISIFNDTQTKPDTISKEIKQKANEHQFHYKYLSSNTASGSNINVKIIDFDTQVPPQELGLKFNLIVGTVTGKGIFNINLRHFGADSKKTNSPSDGEQDINVDFPTKIF